MSEELDPLAEREIAEEQVAEARLLDRFTEEQKIEQLRRILQDEDVRDFLWRLLKHCNVYVTTFDNNFGRMSFNEGARNIGLRLLSDICEADPSAEMKMRRKAIEMAAEEKKQEALKQMRRKARSS
jgi:hypothetical protein